MLLNTLFNHSIEHPIGCNYTILFLPSCNYLELDRFKITSHNKEIGFLKWSVVSLKLEISNILVGLPVILDSILNWKHVA